MSEAEVDSEEGLLNDYVADPSKANPMEIVNLGESTE